VRDAHREVNDVPRKDIIVIGASAGGMEPIRTILGGLPADFSGSLFIAVHMSPDSPGILPSIYDRFGLLPVEAARDGERIVPGRVYVAPPDRHLMIEPGRMCVARGPKENRFRPAVDPLFRSAAQTYGPRVVGIILSGGLDDGTSGLWTVKQLGGTVIVQDPKEAMAPSMPQSAIQHVRVDHVVHADEIAPLLVRLAATAADAREGDVVPENVEIEVNIAKSDEAKDAGVFKLGEPSIFACPECHGVLLQMKDGAPLRFRCHTGHAYSVESLLSEMDEAIEETLWSAIRALDERAMLLRHAEHLPGGQSTSATDFAAAAADTQQRADAVRQVLLNNEEQKTAQQR
jgi:two-component system chemotaxis response regulator CheB